MLLDVLVQVMRLLMADTVFLIICLLLLIPLSSLKPATFAVMKRNLFGYFNNPTGYVFICLFVLVGSAFAFWPHEFFNSNLATLGELNKTFPLVMLLFIPTITMSIWADERRNGTDELLLTIPATDWDIVLGKYLAVAAIFTASLLFSQIANFTVLNILALGDIDTGLFATTYLGYWMIGLAMLSLGMSASFLTRNLTVGFVLGVIFNAPLVLTANADLIIRSSDFAQSVSRWSHAAQFSDFGRGVISFRSIIFFAMVVAIGLYLSIVLIGRRHWYGGKNSEAKLGHYLTRAVSLVVIAIGLNLIFSTFDLFRRDMTSEQVSSLSADTKELLSDLDQEQDTRIEAFISKSVPEQYARTKLDLITMLQEFGARASSRIDVKIYDNLEPFSEGANRAEDQHRIQPETVITEDRGTRKQEQIFLAAAFQRGDEKVVVPFFDQGIPVEYELIRSINTVTDAQRPRIGVVTTKAELFGGFSMAGGMPQQTQRQMIIDELEKQYEVVQVDPNNPYEKFDVLMVVQPSSLTPPQLENLIDAIRAGQPTAIFEDPAPSFIAGAPGTGQPNPPQGGGMMGMMGGGRPGDPKCDITRLWSMLGITMIGEPGFGGPFDASVIFQRYNPYPKARAVALTPEFVFASPDAPGAKQDEAISTQNPITSGLDQLLFAFPGGIRQEEREGMTFEPLVMTGNETGTVKFNDIRTAQQMAQTNPGAELGMILDSFRRVTADRYCLAAKITGKVKADSEIGLAGPSDVKKDESGEAEVNVVFVSDIDLLASLFLMIRARPSAAEVNWQFDNVPFVLNILDSLAGDERLIEIRKRQTRHSTLKMIDTATEEARDSFTEAREDFEKQFSEAETAANSEMQKAIDEIQQQIDDARSKGEQADLQRLGTELQRTSRILQRKTEAKIAKLRRERDSNQKQIERELNQKIVSVQNFYKALAVLLPPIPPLIVGLVVFWKRRQQELEGVIDERRR